jgi:hypothetical protein
METPDRILCVEQLQQLTARLAQERQQLRGAGARPRLLEFNRRELVRAQWALSQALITRYAGDKAA